MSTSDNNSNNNIFEIQKQLDDMKKKLFTDGLLKSIDSVLSCKSESDYTEELSNLEGFINYIMSDIRVSMENRLHICSKKEAKELVKSGVCSKKQHKKVKTKKAELGKVDISTDDRVILNDGSLSMWSHDEFMSKIMDAGDDFIKIEQLCKMQGLSDSETYQLIDSIYDNNDDDDYEDEELQFTINNQKELKATKQDIKKSINKSDIKTKKQLIAHLSKKCVFDKKLTKFIFNSHVDLESKTVACWTKSRNGFKYLPNMYVLSYISFKDKGLDKKILVKSNGTVVVDILDYIQSPKKYRDDMFKYNIATIRRVMSYLCNLGYRDELVKLFSNDVETSEKYAKIVAECDVEDLLFRVRHKSISKESTVYNYNVLVAKEFYLNTNSLNHYSTCRFISMLLSCFVTDLKMVATL